MTIKEVWDIDGGDYTCEVSNSFGVDTATANLKVLAPPVIEKEPGNLSFAEGDMARFKIYFSGSPAFDFKLTVNREEIGPDHPNIKMVEFDDHVLITVKEIHSPDTGRYEFTVSNESGQATCGFYVNVTGLPGPPTGPLGISNIDQHQATLSWKPPKEDGGSKITHYVVEKRDLAKDDWTVVASYVKVTPHHHRSCFSAVQNRMVSFFRTSSSLSKASLKITSTNSEYQL